MSSSTNAKPTRKVEGIINVPPILNGELINIINLELIEKWINGITHFYEGRFLLELVAADLDSRCKQKETVKARASYLKFDDTSKMFKYTCTFEVPENFGKIGAVLVENEHKEKYIKNIVLDNVDITFTCESWIQSKDNNPSKRIFFTNQSYRPSETPKGLMSLREEDLVSLRGNGQGQRKPFERIYDYDMYNDLADPDTRSHLSRPVLGGKEHPYPRRCRTGRPMTTKEFELRKKVHFYDKFYVPRDEAFSDRKVVAFGTMQILYSIKEALESLVHKIKGGNEANIKLDHSFFNIDSFIEKILEFLFDKWVDFNRFENVLKVVVPRFFRDLFGNVKSLDHIDDARKNDSKSFCWYEDEEFCRQTLAGINPYSIQLVTEWPLKSELKPEVYGPAESAITKKIVEQEIKKQETNKQYIMTLEEALKKKKLFLLDYHDLLLPYVNKVRELEETTLYGSRTLMFLTSEGILRPIAIELTSPPNNGKSQWKHVYIPNSDDKTIEAWLWKLAKAHVLAHDSGYHQLISHWLRTHCVMEPYIIATHRCLSKMHPIHRLLFPHLRHTMQINSLARLFLIDAGGIIEATFSLGKYSMEFSSYVYDRQWRFDHEGLPADLISRGMAFEDPSGIKLRIEDYPFANDGLALWDAIKQWATAYVNHYYPETNLVESDKEELQAWWTEIKTIGHKDKKEGWPQLKTQQDLIEIVTTIMWVASGHHSAVNFGQYTAGYYPTRPTIARTKMPNEDPTTKDWEKELLKDPKKELGKCFPTIKQSNRVKSTLDILSSHSPDEEYIGVKMEASWESEPDINKAFGVFRKSLEDLEHRIEKLNNNPKWHNRRGKGKVPYELFKQKSEAGVTGKGVPYSISI